MKNGINCITTFVIGARLLSCEFLKITNPGTNIRADLGDGAITISGPPMTEDTTLPLEYKDELFGFLEELKERTTINIVSAPHRGDLLNVRMALYDMNIDFQQTLEEFSANDLEKIMIKISFEQELCAYVPLSAVTICLSFISTPDELMNFLREEIK